MKRKNLNQAAPACRARGEKQPIPPRIGRLGESLRTLWRKDRLLAGTLLIVLADGLLAPGVWAASGGALSLSTSIWVGLLALTTIGLSVYLFYVMFKPEAF